VAALALLSAQIEVHASAASNSLRWTPIGARAHQTRACAGWHFVCISAVAGGCISDAGVWGLKGVEIRSQAK